MNRQEIREYMKKASASGIRPGLDRVIELMKRLGNPQDSFDVIHVAGTNGKGSTSAYIASILTHAYGKIGWFSSPAVIDERESIRVIVSDEKESSGDTMRELLGKSNLPDAVYESVMTEVIGAAKEMTEEGFEQPTEFELETAGAYLAFAKEKVDIAIIEVGMGGRLDATNVLSHPLVCVITPIGLDHMQFLGASIYQIAGEKAGIIKKGTHVVTWQPGVRLSGVSEGTREEIRQARFRDRVMGRLRSEAEEKEADFTTVDPKQLRIDTQELVGTGFTYQGEPYFTGMIGSYQPGNAALAIEAVRKLGAELSLDMIREGIAEAVLPARFDIVEKDPLTIYDGAHNPDAAMALADSLKACLPGRRIYGVMGIFKDKVVEEVVRILSPHLTGVVTVKAPGERGLEAEALKEVFRHVNPWLSVETGGDDVRDVVKRVQNKAKKDGAAVLIFGSLSLAKEVYRRETLLSYLQDKKVPIAAPCGGQGTCGNCRVRVIAGEVPVSEADRRIFTEEELAQGYRLACRADITGQEEEIEVELSKELSSIAALGAEMYRGEEKPASEAGSGAQVREEPMRPYGIAVDVGTTTLAVSLVKLPEGRVVETRTCMNPQTRYGADVVTRIRSAVEGKAEELRIAVCEALLEQIETNLVFHGIGYADIEQIVIAGNTTMLHLLQGYSVNGLKSYPFTSKSLSLEKKTVGDIFQVVPDWELDPIAKAVPVTILPGTSAYVGADIVAGMYALDFYKKDTISALIDLGTNGEIVVGDKNHRIVTSTAAGPALEGGNIRQGVAGVKGAIAHVSITREEDGEWTVEKELIAGGTKPVGICGSGVIDVVAELRRSGLIDETGLLAEDYFEKGFPLNVTPDILFSQDDIRQVQMAKAAIRAGFDVLLERYGIKPRDLEHLYIAGGFGTFLRIESAAAIGLIPKELENRTEAVGNTALAGAIRFLTDPEAEKKLTDLAENSELVSLAGQEEFQDRYIDEMSF